MPQQPSPPFVAGAITDPRQLDRWLDINPQGGGLKRTETFIVFPAFSQAVTWKGYSEIVAAFNFEGPNNFSLIPFVTPTTPNYALAIMWKSNGMTYRYWLWMGVGEVIYFPQTLYTQQLVKKNFRLEVWSTNNTPAIQTAPLTFYTSVQGNYDYMWQLDTNLVSNDPEVTNFQSSNGAINFPVIPNLKCRWTVASGLVGTVGGLTSWTDVIAGEVASPLSTISVRSAATYSLGNYGGNVVLASGGDATCNVSGLAFLLQTVAVVFAAQAGSNNTIFFDQDGDNTIIYNATTGIINLEQNSTVICTVSGLVEHNWYVVVVSLGNMWVFNLSNGTLLGNSSGNVILSGNATTIGVGGASVNTFADIVLGSGIITTLSQAEVFAAYFSSFYYSNGSNFSLPLTFPANSSPTTN